MDGRNSERRYPSIEVAPADSELHKRTARQGVGYVEALRHILHKTRRNVSADENIQFCSIGTGGKDQKRKTRWSARRFIFDDLGRG